MRFTCSLALALVLAGCDTCGVRPAPPSAADDVHAPARVIAARRHPWDEAERARTIAAGKALLARHECNRCHVIDDVPASSRPTHCVSCHVFLEGLGPDDHAYETITSRYGRDVVERYQRNIVHFVAVPDLTLVARRLRPEWIATFVRDPHDLRPLMEETMVRTQMSEDDARALARYFAAVAEVAPPREGDTPELGPAPSRAHIEEGERLFRQRGCTLCHTFGNRPTGKTEAELLAVGAPARLAPNLRFARERLDRAVLVAWIRDPHAFLASTTMPNLAVGAEDAERLADFILFADPRLGPVPTPELTLPPAVAREVTYEEMKERVLGRVCVHCHMNDHERDPGPGNEGGFGYAGQQLSMRTYEMLVTGFVTREARAAHGADAGVVSHTSALVPDATGVPPILAAMLRRRAEVPRDFVRPFRDHAIPPRTDARLGMPMGLPPLDDEAFGVLRAWIEQGCVGPATVSGMPGIDDGFLVPDGPVARNRGCEVRAPAAERPAWATAPPPAWERPRDAGSR